MSSENSYFRERWLSDERFKDWLVPPQTKREARCKRCKKSFALSNMGVQALKNHAEGRKHKQLCAAVAVFLKTKPVTKSTRSSPDLSPVSSTSLSSGRHVTQKTLELTVTKLQTFSAEIRRALKSVLKGHSNNSSSNISPLFKVMFPDSKIFESFAVGADNCVIR